MPNYHKDFVSFLKKESSKERLFTTQLLCMDRAFKIPRPGYFLINSEPYAGGTTVALKLTEALSKDYPILYNDIGGALLKHRLYGLNLENLFICKPRSAKEILSLTRDINNEGVQDLIIVLDSFKFLDLDLHLKEAKTLFNFLAELRKINSSYTVIGVQRESAVSSIWSDNVHIKRLKNVYVTKEGNSLLWGHFAEISGSLGKSKVFISHITGRVSDGYDIATRLVEQGLKKNSVFKYNNIEAHGFSKFVWEYDNYEFEISKL